MAVSFAEIKVGSWWSRNALAQLWGYQSFHAIARGVVTPIRDNKIILFVTEEKQATATNYQDVLREDILEWEGPNDHFAEERMLSARERGEEIHLFHRQRHHADFEYRGQLSLMQSQPKSLQPSKFVFEVLDGDRRNWTRDQTLASFFLYLQAKPAEMQTASPGVAQLAASLNKPPQAVAAKLRTFTQLDPVLSHHHIRATDNVTPLDEAVWKEFQTDWTATAQLASEAFDAVVGAYEPLAATAFASASDAAYLYQAGETREAIVQVRKNQHVFRKAILSSYGSRCCITGLENERLLVASHIVPWAQDPQNRLNPENGLCLSALHDRAYDQGLLTVLPDYTVRVGQAIAAQKGNDFLSDALLKYDGRTIALPGRFRPAPGFLDWHARRFGFIA